MDRNLVFLAAIFVSSALHGVWAGEAGAEPAGGAVLQDQERPGIGVVVLGVLQSEGVEAAIARYRELRARSPEEYDFGENQLNAVGYWLLNRDRVGEAIEIFKLNVEMFPGAHNPYDSLGEAYIHAGDYELARTNFDTALEISPGFGASLANLNKIYIMAHYTKHEYMIPMRDGVKLFTQVYVPLDDSAEYPIMLQRTPYRVNPLGVEKYNYHQQLGPSIPFAEEGYIFVYQDVRGCYMSEGEFLQMRPLEPEGGGVDESTDTYDTIQWLLDNVPNNNGRVGMWGISYPGVYAAMALVNQHPALKAVSPQAPPADWFLGDDWHHNGAFFFLQCVNWMRGAGIYRPEPIDHFVQRLFDYPTAYLYDWYLSLGPVSVIDERFFNGRVPFWTHMMGHGAYDDFWKARCTLGHYSGVQAAVMTVGGWFDAENLYGALKTYAAIEDLNPGATNTFVMGPWYHGGWAWHNTELLGDVDVRAASSARHYRENIELPFFSYYLKDEGEFEVPEMLAFETGSNQWRRYGQWPPAGTEQRSLYLRADGALGWTAPAESGEAYDEYVSDPARPVPHKESPIPGWSYEWMHADQRFAARRPDVLVFQTEPLEADVTVAGPIQAELYVSTTGTDADWVVKVIDVYPPDQPPNADGDWMGDYQMLVRGDVMRGKFRNSFEIPEPFEPGGVARVRFELQDVNHCFRAGHRIMVQVQSSWFPLVDRNPQTFCDIYSAGEEDFRKATHRVYFSEEYPSHVEVLVVGR